LYNYLKENRTKVLFIPLVIYWIIILIGTTIPADSFVDTWEISDKIKHFVAYFGLAILLGLNLHFQERWKKISLYYIIATLVICLTYGVLDELHQLFVPNRMAEFWDWVADSLGTITGLLVVSVFLQKIIKKKVVM
jgi:VanZ family protein